MQFVPALVREHIASITIRVPILRKNFKPLNIREILEKAKAGLTRKVSVKSVRTRSEEKADSVGKAKEPLESGAEYYP